MKNDAIAKIHKFGKIGYTISKIVMVISIILFIMLFIVTLLFSLFPRNLFTMYTSGQAVFEMDSTGIADDLEIDQKAKESKIDGTFAFSTWDSEYELVDIRQEGNIIRLVGESEPTVFRCQDLSIISFFMGIWLVLEMFVVHFLKKLCKIFSVCETPFTQEIIGIMPKLFYSLIPLIVFSMFGNSIPESILKGKLQISMDLNLLMVIALLLVFLLTFIFKYGAMLQQESDETL